MESIELVARHHLNVKNVQVLTPGTNIRRLIVEDYHQVGVYSILLGGYCSFYSNQVRMNNEFHMCATTACGMAEETETCTI